MSPATVSRTLWKCLVQMEYCDALREITPEFFQKSFWKKSSSYYGFFSERPSVVKAKAMAWSNYKHHNTMKIILTTLGVISFVAESWVGHVSDKCSTGHSGILLLGDVIADYGFDIGDLVAAKQANFDIRTKGKVSCLH